MSFELIQAVNDGDLKKARELLKSGADASYLHNISKGFSRYITPLSAAIDKFDLIFIKELCENGANLNAVCGDNGQLNKEVDSAIDYFLTKIQISRRLDEEKEDILIYLLIKSPNIPILSKSNLCEYGLNWKNTEIRALFFFELLLRANTDCIKVFKGAPDSLSDLDAEKQPEYISGKKLSEYLALAPRSLTVEDKEIIYKIIRGLGLEASLAQELCKVIELYQYPIVSKELPARADEDIKEGEGLAKRVCILEEQVAALEKEKNSSVLEMQQRIDRLEQKLTALTNPEPKSTTQNKGFFN